MTMITRPKESATPRWPSACVVESTMIAPQPAKTRANVPNTSAASLRVSSVCTLARFGKGSGSRDDVTEVVERAGRKSVVGEAPAPLALEQPGIVEQLEVVRDGGLLEPGRLGEVAHADRLAAGPRKDVEDLDAVAVGERLEERLELDCLRVREGRASDGLARGDEWEDAGHRRKHYIECSRCQRDSRRLQQCLDEEIGNEPLDSPVDLVADRAHGIERLGIGGVVEHPVLVALAREDRTRIAASHGDHHIGGAHEVVRERLWEGVGEIDPQLGHRFDDQWVDCLSRRRPGGADADMARRPERDETRRHLSASRVVHADEQDLRDPEAVGWASLLVLHIEYDR